MGIGLGTAALISGITGLAGAGIGAHAAGNAADAQAAAAEKAAQLQYQASQNALDFEKQQYAQNQANMAPWLNTGAGALGNLAYLMGVSPRPIGTPARTPATLPSGYPYSIPSTPASPGAPALSGGRSELQSNAIAQPVSGLSLPSGSSGSPTPSGASSGAYGSLMQPYGQTFSAPTGLSEQNDPGYQARLKLGTDALQRSAAARGNLLSGGTAAALDRYAQDYASNEYNNVYNRALNTFNNNYNEYNQNQNNQFNRLAALSGVGQTAAGQLGTLGQNTANAVSSNLLNTGAQMGQDYQNAGAANASGYAGAANAWNGALGGIGNNMGQLALLQQLYGGGGSGNFTGTNELEDLGI